MLLYFTKEICCFFSSKHPLFLSSQIVYWLHNGMVFQSFVSAGMRLSSNILWHHPLHPKTHTKMKSGPISVVLGGSCFHSIFTKETPAAHRNSSVLYGVMCYASIFAAIHPKMQHRERLLLSISLSMANQSPSFQPASASYYSSFSH